MEELISAISTAAGVGGVAIIRMSGNGAKEVAEKMFKPLGKTQVKDFEPYKLYVGEIDCGTFTDFGMAVFFKAPKSYTGEDMVEFHCHGGIAITRGVLRRTIELGATPAGRGEFTKRAFVNGKLTLDSCEGLIDMINSESLGEVKAGYYLYREKLKNIIEEVQEGLTYALASIDANIDYPEEGLEDVAYGDTEKAILSAREKISKLLGGYDSGRKIKNGVKVALVGKPNTGKSSILNRFLNYDKAIVSSVAGTTRDVVEGKIELEGVTFNFFDTAGIHDSNDEIENFGIEKSKTLIKTSDVVLFITEAGIDKDETEEELGGIDYIKVYNKADLTKCERKGDGIYLSALTGENFDELKKALVEKAFGGKIDLNADLLTEERHFNALLKAQKYCDEALSNITSVPLELIATDVKEIWNALGEITGKTASEDIIDEIFSKFCVGK